MRGLIRQSPVLGLHAARRSISQLATTLISVLSQAIPQMALTSKILT